MNPGLPKLSGGIRKARREVWDKPCALRACDRPAAGVIDTLSGPQPIWAEHIPSAELHGYHVRLEAEATP